MNVGMEIGANGSMNVCRDIRKTIATLVVILTCAVEIYRRVNRPFG